MSLLYFKILAAVLIWFVAFIAGWKTLKSSRSSHTRMYVIGDSFASGVFLGAGLLHMLPDSIAEFSQIFPKLNYPIANVLCAVGFVFLLFLEKVVFKIVNLSSQQKVNLFPWMLTLILSTHALIEGIALGINTTIATASIIFFAILAHKGSESFALATKLRQSQMLQEKVMLIFFVFTLVTPLGIGLGADVSSIFNSETSLLIQAVFNAIAAGSFLYIATLHYLSTCEAHYSESHLLQFSSLVLGLVTMAIIAIWV